MSRQLFINNANAVPAAAGGTTDPTEVTTARVAAFNADDWASGTVAFDEAFTGDKVVFVQGGASGEDAIISSIINMDDVEAVYEKEYVAPTAQVTALTAVEAPSDGTVAVRITRVDQGFRPEPSFSAEVQVKEGDTAANIATALAEAINNANQDFVTATTSTADIIITGNLEASFFTATQELAAEYEIDVTEPNFGTGTSDHVKNLEEIAWGGNYQNRIYLPIEPPRYTVDGETYDLFTILVRTNTTENIAKSNKYQEITIAVQSSATGIDLPVFFGFEETSA